MDIPWNQKNRLLKCTRQPSHTICWSVSREVNQAFIFVNMTTSLPTRLFKKSGEFGVLVPGKDLPAGTKYCAVSHVWGKVDPDPFDFPNIPWKVPATSKDKVISIVEACAKKYQYIWFDILCIRQGKKGDIEAERDRDFEMRNMKQYYKNSDATFVFGSDYQTFAERWGKVDPLLSAWEKDKDGGNPQTLQKIWQGLGDIDRVVGSADASKGDQWFWRVWTLQETLLPPLLFTSTGTPMHISLFCDFIDWTYIALAKRILDNNGPASYNWIHPGHGVVNDNGWWMLSHSLGLAKSLGDNLDPLQALAVTANRQISPDHPKDTLFAAYGLIGEKWHVKDMPEYTFDDVWRLTVSIYVQDHDLAPLLAMAVTTTDHMTWAAGRARYTGSVIPKAGVWKNPTAKMDGYRLQLSVPEVSKITLIPGNDVAYGDGSGELSKLLDALGSLKAKKYDISSVTALLIRAIEQAKVSRTGDSLEELTRTIRDHGIAQANAVSSGLRAVFNGWDRWFVTTDRKQVFLAWIPDEDPKAWLNAKGSLLWSLSDGNEWAAIVEGDLNGCKKRGLAFTNSFKPSSTSQAVVLL